ncbi:MAG: DUF2835 family protein [Pseudomonadota bacterium]
MKSFYFSMNMNYAQCDSLYHNTIRYVVVKDDNGKTIQLKKSHVLKFLTPEGIKGRFRLDVDDNNAFKQLQRLAKI